MGPFLEAALSSTPGASVLFICDPDDEPEKEAIERLGGEFITFAGNYAEKIRAGVQASTEPLLFLAADDLEPQIGWFEAARAKLGGAVHVVGINDMIERPRRPEHATHFLITRSYARLPTIDGGQGPMHEGYFHWCCDDELIGTAIKRGVYAYASDARVRHLHPMAGGTDDSTYEAGRAHAREDLRLFRARRTLWT